MKNLVKHLMSARMFFPIFVSIVLFGCGGGGGENTPPSVPVFISGTAAAGAPVVGYVSVRDSSSNPQPVRTGIPIDANGNFTVEVTGLTAPYAFQASGTVGGRSVSLYSAATAEDEGHTINITPFTDLMIRNIAAAAVDNYVDSGAYVSLTSAELDAQRIALTQQLTPALLAMGLSDSIDLLRATFNADSTGLDRFMDVVQVSISGTTATITNIIDAANTLIIDTTTGETTGTLGTGGLSSSGTPVDGIMSTFTTFSALFANHLPGASDPALLSLFADSFMKEGVGSSVFIEEITTSPDMIGVQFANVVIDSLDVVGGEALVHFTVIFAGGITLPDKAGGTVQWWMKLDGGTWKIDGDRRIATVAIRPGAQRSCNAASCTNYFYRTGLDLIVSDDAQRIGIAGAVVTGPGLPDSGVLLLSTAGQDDLVINSPPNPLCVGCSGGSLWYMADSDIAVIAPNSTYTIQLYDSTATLLATYTEVLPVAPGDSATTASRAYPSFTNSLTNLVGTTSSTQILSWSVPTNLRAGGVSAWTANSTQEQYVEDDLTNTLAKSGTSTLALGAPASGVWTQGAYSVLAWDGYGGWVNTYYWY